MNKPAQLTLAALVIVLLAAMAIPNFVKARKVVSKSACLENLRLVQVAKNRWAEIYHKGPTDRPTASDLFSETNAIAFSQGTDYLPAAFARMPAACPSEGTLLIGAMNEAPQCIQV